MKTIKVLALLLLLSASVKAAGPSTPPFKFSSDISGGTVTIEVDKNAYLYSDKFKISIADSSGRLAKILSAPSPVTEKDQFNEEHSIYSEGRHEWKFSADGLAGGIKAYIDYQACGKSPFVCYPPMKVQYNISGEGGMSIPDNIPQSNEIKPAARWQEAVGRFVISASESGYMDAKDFSSFLDDSLSRGKPIKKPMFVDLKDKSLIISLILILIGGLALNLTPCVLPMIPVNIAIIGAGANSSSRLNGFVLGLMYGTGITLVYGLLGLAAVLTGSTFGAINSSPYFNFAVGLIFIFLALGMFDVFPIDFSKFLKSGETNKRRSLATAMSMGGISALLAGACVAPVVIAVLLFSSYLYSQGDFYGLLMPFVLGAGMALPWPFAGAGLSLLPKPGAWMIKVKYAFGIFIAAIAAYYLFTGYSLASKKENGIQKAGWNSSIAEALAEAQKENRPLLIDFTASWCKNCEAMDLTTLKDPKVLENLKRFVKLKFAAENPNEPATKEVLSYFKVLGLPTYVVLKPDMGKQ
ncbi:MAG: cytochrome c biogenesis protein CcdA [Victivallales bacterium]